MRYVMVLSFLIAVALVIWLSAAQLKRSSSGSSYDAAVGAAQKAAGAAEQHVQDVLKNTFPGR